MRDQVTCYELIKKFEFFWRSGSVVEFWFDTMDVESFFE